MQISHKESRWVNNLVTRNLLYLEQTNHYNVGLCQSGISVINSQRPPFSCPAQHQQYSSWLFYLTAGYVTSGIFWYPQPISVLKYLQFASRSSVTAQALCSKSLLGLSSIRFICISHNFDHTSRFGRHSKFFFFN